MIDFHSHILPGIDDGSRHMDDTWKMISMEHEQGVTQIVATPHFYANRDSVSHFLKRRDIAYKAVTELVSQKENVPTLHLGAEVYYFPGIGKGDMVSKLCVEGTSTILLELPFCQWTKDMLNDIKLLLQEQQLQVVLAHVERYYEFQKKKDVWNEMLELPVMIQLNGGSFIKWKRRRLCMQLLEQKGTAILGSDCHNLTTRVPNLGEARKVIEKKYGREMLERMDEVAERVLSR